MLRTTMDISVLGRCKNDWMGMLHDLAPSKSSPLFMPGNTPVYLNNFIPR